MAWACAASNVDCGSGQPWMRQDREAAARAVRAGQAVRLRGRDAGVEPDLDPNEVIARQVGEQVVGRAISLDDLLDAARLDDLDLRQLAYAGCVARRRRVTSATSHAHDNEHPATIAIHDGLASWLPMMVRASPARYGATSARTSRL